MTTATNLRAWRMRRDTEALLDEYEAVAGNDLYPRRLKRMSHEQCDALAHRTMKLPLNEIRRKRKSLRMRFLRWWGLP